MDSKGLPPNPVCSDAAAGPTVPRPNTAPSGQAPGTQDAARAVLRGGWQSWVLPARVRTGTPCSSRISVWRAGGKQEPGGESGLGLQWCLLAGRVRKSGFDYASRRARPNPKPLSGQRQESESENQEEA